MDMEQRKVNWRNRIWEIANKSPSPMTAGQVRLIVSICQDAFNEGHTAGAKTATDFFINRGVKVHDSE